MITILHGDDTTASRNAYHLIKTQAQHPQTFEADKVSLTDLMQILEGGGLFVQKQEVFLEQVLSKKKDSKELAAISTLLQQHAADHTIVLWEGKELTKKQLEIISKATVRVFKLPGVLFTFLESIKPGNTKVMLSLFQQTLQTAGEEMVFFMLIRQIRILLALKDPQSAIEEVRRIAPWQKGKLQAQANAFTPKQLVTFYQKLAQADLQHKTGADTVPLAHTIDFLLLEV